MSDDSGENFIKPTGLSDSTIITVHGSSTENAGTTNTDTETHSHLDDEMTEDTTGDNINNFSSEDVNTDDLTAFEDGMKKLRVSPKKDSNDITAVVADRNQLFETCSMISSQQHSKYPAKPPKSCLMDQVTVSVITSVIYSLFYFFALVMVHDSEIILGT